MTNKTYRIESFYDRDCLIPCTGFTYLSAKDDEAAMRQMETHLTSDWMAGASRMAVLSRLIDGEWREVARSGTCKYGR